MAAFGTNAMLLAQFPTPTVRERLQVCIAAKALADIRDPKTAVLVVRDDESGNGEVVSFAKWSLPVREGETYVEAPWVWPEGTDLEVLDRWTGVVEGAKERVVGEGACYRKLVYNIHAIYVMLGSQFPVYGGSIGRQKIFLLMRLSAPIPFLANCLSPQSSVAHPTLGLTFIGTDPLHERRGAASLLLQWGLRQSKQDNVPAYLESTVDAGSLYERHGFASAENISMVLAGREGESVIYEEVCFIFRPGATSDAMKSHTQSAN